VHLRPDGKPLVSTGGVVSIAHAPSLTLAVGAAAGAIGCDLEAVQPRGDDWRDLLGGEHLALARLIRERAGEDFDTAATRVWTALECQRKANMRPSVPLLLDALPENGWLMLRGGQASIASAVLTLRGVGRVAVAVLPVPAPTDTVAGRMLAEVK
jgi:enediyne polyketide synthase